MKHSIEGNCEAIIDLTHQIHPIPDVRMATPKLHAAITTIHPALLLVEHLTLNTEDGICSPLDNPLTSYYVTHPGHVGISEEAYALLQQMAEREGPLSGLSFLQTGRESWQMKWRQDCFRVIDAGKANAGTHWTLPPKEAFQTIANHSVKDAISADEPSEEMIRTWLSEPKSYEPSFDFDLDKVIDSAGSGVVSFPSGLTREERKAWVRRKLQSM